MRTFNPLRAVGHVAGRAASAAATYVIVLRPLQRQWGATYRERVADLPGDARVPRPGFRTTRALTVKARPEEIWPWLMQMGRGRRGFYTWVALESRLGLEPRHPHVLSPDARDLEPGDEVTLSGRGLDWLSGARGLTVHEVEPNRVLVLGADTPAGPATVSIVLTPRGSEHTRLTVRVQWAAHLTPRTPLWYAALDPGEFVAVRQWLLGIKRRAEHQAAERRVVPEVRPAAPAAQAPFSTRSRVPRS